MFSSEEYQNTDLKARLKKLTTGNKFEVSKSSVKKHTTSYDKGVFYYHYYLATSTTD